MSKDQSSTPEAEHITALTTTDRLCSVVNSIRLDHIPLCVCVSWSASILSGNKRKTYENVLISPQASKESAFTSGQLSYAVSGSSNTRPNLDQRRTEHVVRALSVVG